MDFQAIRYKVQDSAAFITLDEPRKRNPLSKRVKQELCHAFDLCDKDTSVRVVVIRGAGGFFSAGGDATEKKEAIDKGIFLAREACELGAATNLRLRQIRKPTIAWVEGVIAGSALTLALACDFQIVSSDTVCTFAFVNMAIVPDCGSTYIVTHALGTTRASDLLLSGRRFTGQEGAQWGLFTEAAPPDALESRVLSYIETYKNGPTVAYASIKELINQVQYAELMHSCALETSCLERCEQTEDYKIAVSSFLEKKTPHFIGR